MKSSEKNSQILKGFDAGSAYAPKWQICLERQPCTWITWI